MQVDRDRCRRDARDDGAGVHVDDGAAAVDPQRLPGAPERLELGTLYDNIRVLGNNAQKTSRFEIAFWNKVFYPLAVLVMMVLALPFAHFQRRQGGVGFRIFAGTMIGLSFFLLGRLFSNLGVLNDWPPLFSAVFPLALFTAIAIGDAVVDRAAVARVSSRSRDAAAEQKPRARRGLRVDRAERARYAVFASPARRSRTCAGARP